jgi:hypothetical protein
MRNTYIFGSAFMVLICSVLFATTGYSQTYVCKPPTKYTFNISPGVATPLLCRVGNGYNTPIGNFSLDEASAVSAPVGERNESGYALARLRLSYKNNAPVPPAGSYFTDGVHTIATALKVGDGSAYATNQILCPTELASAEQQISYGYLAPGAVIDIASHVTRSECQDNKVSVFGGGVLEVWVEDPAAQCQQKSIAFATTYNTVGFLQNWVDSSGVAVGAVWQRSVLPFETSPWLKKKEINRVTLPAASGAVDMNKSIYVMGNVEGSPRNSPELACNPSLYNNNNPLPPNEDVRPRAGAELFAVGSTNTSPDISIAKKEKWLPTADHMGHFNLGLYAVQTMTSGQKTYTMKVFTNVDPIRVYNTSVTPPVIDVNASEPQATNPNFYGADPGAVDIFTGAGKGYANIGVVRE